MPYASLARMFMKRQELSANRQVVQNAVLVRGRGGGTDPSSGPRRLVRVLVAVHLLPREEENIVLGGRGAPEKGLFQFSLRGCGPASGGRGKASLGGSVEHQYPIRCALAIRVGSGEDVST